ncbi:MAG: AMP-binding protein, partial [Clostridia bacterium]
MEKQGYIYENFVDYTLDENGVLKELNYINEDNFNFAFDVVDALAEKCPDKTALIYVSNEKECRRFTFKEVSEYSNRAANYFEILGIKRGDRVMLVLKRHYQFWF